LYVGKGAGLKSEDRVLVERCLKGEERAFEELLNKYKNSVYSICYRMVRNQTDAEDLAQDVFIRTFSVLDRYDPSYPFSSWLFRITSNLCIDFLRKAKGGMVSLDQPIEGSEGAIQRQLPANVVKPDRQMENKEMMAALEEAILRHQEQMSYEEIADDLGIPLGTVKARIHRARNMIKEFFRKSGLLDVYGGHTGENREH
jgi:RNA polymerase sigma factor (sigma-70 family)